jgi:predicted nucleic acid-binding protein
VKVVLDANVLLAGFCFQGMCRAVIEVCVDSHEIVLSEYLLDEVRHHLHHTMEHSHEQADQRIEWLRSVASLVTPADVPLDSCVRKKDRHFRGMKRPGSRRQRYAKSIASLTRDTT